MRYLALLGLLVFGLTATLPAQPYGSGFPGTAGLVPKIQIGSPYMGNANFGITVSNGLGGASGLIGLSLARSSFFVGQTEILIDPSPNQLSLVLPFALSGPVGLPGLGTATAPIPLAFPPIPSLAGLRFHAQGVVLSDNATPGSPAATAGISFELSLPPSIFVGTSVGGSADPYWFVDPTTQSVTTSGGNGNTNNVTAAVFTQGGSNVFVASSITNSVSRGDLSGPTPQWSTAYTSPTGSTYGMGYDITNRLLYTLTGPSPSTRELVAIDGDPASGAYGTMVSSTINLSSGFAIERWQLSPSGKLAAVLSVFGSPVDQLILVDTDPTSSGYMQVLSTTPIAGTGGLNVPWEVRFAPDDSAAWVILGSFSGELARFDVASGSFTDFNSLIPGVQHLGVSSDPPLPVFGSLPVGVAVAHGGDFVIVSGTVPGGAFVTRVDLTPGMPTLVSATVIPVPVPFSWGYSPTLAPDDSELAVTSFGNSPPELILIDPLSASVNGRVPLVGGSNIYTALYR